jgi:hypothetical protein
MHAFGGAIQFPPVDPQLVVPDLVMHPLAKVSGQAPV